MTSTDSDIVFQSYGRVCNRDRFYIDFYDHFMSSSEVIRVQFVETDMKQQRHLLRNGIMQLVLHARGMPDTKLRALGQSHNRTGYDIKPEWYALWFDALMNTLSKHDPHFSSELEASWRRAIEPGIRVIKDAY